jgi:6-phosphogluconolactonase
MKWRAPIKIEVFDSEETTARAAAKFIAAEATAAVSARGRFVLAVSGGHTPWITLLALRDESCPWKEMYVVQVDERLTPAEDPDRNLTHLKQTLLDGGPIAPEHVYAMDVESPNPEAAAKRYASYLRVIAGSPPVLDLVHLGLGADGHTASLVPHDPVLDLSASDVGLTGIYQGRRRMTLTYPIINRARCILWLVTGSEKRDMLVRLRSADLSIPAGRVRQDHAVIFADRAAAEVVRSKQSGLVHSTS